MKKKIPLYNFQWKEIYTFPCTVTINAYNAFKYKIFHFSELTPQATILGFHKIVNDTFLVQNHILPVLKLHIYNARKYSVLSFNNVLNEISEIKNIERGVARNNRNKCERFRKKWHRVENKIPYDLIRNKQKKSTLYESREEGPVG